MTEATDGEKSIKTEEVKGMLAAVKKRREDVQKSLVAQINRLFDDLSDVVIAYPNNQKRSEGGDIA